MNDIHDGSDFRLHDDYGISLPSLGQHYVQCLKLGPLWLNWGGGGGFFSS